MNEISLNFRKEFKKFFSRSYMVKWLLTTNVIVLVFSFLSFVEDNVLVVEIFDGLNLPKDNVDVALALFAINFFPALMPINLSMDTIIGEKKFNTMETLISLPINVFNIFFGKLLFILFIVFTEIIFLTFLSNVIVYFSSGNTYANLFGLNIVLLNLVSTMLGTVIIAFLGTILSLVNNNVKGVGYTVSFIALVLTLLNCKNVIFKNIEDFLFLIVIEIIGIVFLSVFLKKNISKSTILKYVK